jgi:hypothetical protein
MGRTTTFLFIPRYERYPNIGTEPWTSRHFRRRCLPHLFLSARGTRAIRIAPRRREKILSKVAITQRPPVLLDLGASLNCALAIVEETADAGAQLIVFPEAFLPGYPTWIWRLKPGGDMGLGNEIHARLRANAVDVSNGGLKPPRAEARRRDRHWFQRNQCAL